jgi:hypothetical protein
VDKFSAANKTVYSSGIRDYQLNESLLRHHKLISDFESSEIL